MKLSTEQVNKLRELAFAGISNKEIAQQLGISMTEVYAYRSRHGITRDKVAKANGEAPSTHVVTQQSCTTAPHKPTVHLDFKNAESQKGYISLRLEKEKLSLDFKGNGLTIMKMLENALVEIMLICKQKEATMEDCLESEFGRIREVAKIRCEEAIP